MSEPVTVAITRELEPGHEPEMLSWLSAGTSLAQRFPGFLGAGWVRPEEGSRTWHMLYRFADQDSLVAWEQSSERQWWRASAQGLGVVDQRVEQRTGIEGWFDEPTDRSVHDPDPARTPPAPPRWKQAVMIWLVFFPLSLSVTVSLAALVPGVAVGFRVLLSTVLMTPVMTYLALPWITKQLSWWLAGDPAPWKRPDNPRVGAS